MHRFFKEDQIPDWDVEYLFVGTFNPEWNRKDQNNANYFYGRYTNDFWYIMPQVFYKDNLMDKKYREDKIFLKSFLKENKIGITDLILKIENVDEFNIIHNNDILSFKDKKLEKYDLKFNTENILKIIDQNKLKGVFFTRKIQEKSIICQNWITIKNYCISKSINAGELITPSRGYRRNGFNREKKLETWKSVIIQ